MVNLSEYSELRDVLPRARSRPLTSVRRAFQKYKWWLTILAMIIFVMLFAGVISLVFSSLIDNPAIEQPDTDGDVPDCGKNNSCISPEVETLLSVTWPRRDSTWYWRRWKASRMRNIKWPTLSNESDSRNTSTREKRQSSFEEVEADGSDDFIDFTDEEIDPYASHWTAEDGSTFPPNDTYNWNREAGESDSLTIQEIRNAMAEAEISLEKLKTLEQSLVENSLRPSKASASYHHQKMFRRTSPKVKNMRRSAYKMLQATLHVKKERNLTTEVTTFDCMFMADIHHSSYCFDSYLSERKSDYIMYPSYRLAKSQLVHRECLGKEKYRTPDGSCNNLRYPSWGASFKPFRRAMPSYYADGVESIRRSITGVPLPSAKLISREVHYDVRTQSKSFTHLTMTWGQFVDHDITATAQTLGSDGSSISCCSDEIKYNSSLLHPDCLPIKYTDDDGLESCMEFVRSAPAPTCSLGPRQQLNQVTSYLDASNTYGSSEKELRQLRSYSDGKLMSQVGSDGVELLPADTTNNSCNVEERNHFGEYCFRSGDARVNEQILLTGMHTILHRQHNLFATELSYLNPEWEDEKLFQETRRIVSAVLQHITYNEYLPNILGGALSKGLGLMPLKSGYTEGGYNKTVHPSIANEFAAAAFRFGHSSIQGLVQSVSDGGQVVSFTQLHNFFFNPFSLYKPDQLSGFIRGQTSQKMMAVDPYFTEQVTKHLFEPKNVTADGPGLDLVAINIQRGRDHGVAPYVRWRQWCGLKDVRNFDDLQVFMHPEAVENMQKVYKNVADIDLFTGGVSELPLEDGLVGPTFACIIADQFKRLKIGDRFWYETNESPQAFTPDQLREIRKSTLAGLICNGVEGLNFIQRFPFRAFGVNNPRVSCSSSIIPTVDLSPWEDDLVL